MCLGVPGQIIEVRGNIASVDFYGTIKDVRLDVLEVSVSAGDYIVNHAGYAIRRIDDDQVMDTLAMYEVVLCEAGEDPIAAEIGVDFDDVLDLELTRA